jgi:hypothetical protein
MMRVARLGLVALAAALAPIALGACDEAKEKGEEAGARGTAEAYRVSLKAQDADEGSGGIRSVEVLRGAATDLPGDPDITGIADGDGDRRDDDGFVQVKVGDESACVTLPESGDDVDVSGGACPGS